MKSRWWPCAALLLFLCSAVTASPLSDYYLTKYPMAEREAARLGVESILPWSAAAQRQAVQDVLTYDRVIYHPTRRHDFLKNLAVLRAWRSAIQQACDRYHVPAAPVEAIITWENSGGVGTISPAGCVGLGQLGEGAVAHSHGRVPGLAARHRALARAAHVADERLLPICNIEDAVVFFGDLREHFGGASDLAIAAYHNGQTNMDDLVRVWLGRHHPDLLSLPMPDAVQQSDVTYWDLWTDRYVREIMAGLRTMEGEPLNDQNGGAMLGDESDIYLWKVVGAYGAALSPTPVPAQLVERYRTDGDVAETAGLPTYLSQDLVRQGLIEHRLVQFEGRPMLPEVAGFVRRLETAVARLLPAGQKPRLKLGQAIPTQPAPWLTMSGIPVMTDDAAVHVTGASIDIYVSSSDAAGRAISHVLNELFTLDRIYWSVHRTSDPRTRRYRVTLNPRFAAEFL